MKQHREGDVALQAKEKSARLFTRQELMDHEDRLPPIADCCWWLADVDPTDEDYVAYAEGNYTEEDMFCAKDEANTWLRVALDLEGGRLNAGDEFVHNGYVFTALTPELAISNNYLGCTPYYDEKMIPYLMDGDVNCTLPAIIATMLEG